MSDEVKAWIDEAIERLVAAHTEAEFPEEWDLVELVRAMESLYGTPDVTADELEEDRQHLTRDGLAEDFQEDAQERYAEKEQELGGELMREIERYLILQIVDRRWREHLENMDYLRDGIHLRAMAQKDPLTEYRAEGHLMFEELGFAIREEVVMTLYHAQIEPAEVEDLQVEAVGDGDLAYQHESLAGADAIAAAGGGAATATAAGASTAVATPIGGGGALIATQQRTVSEHEKLGRNDPCWCGSGKKYKKCHGR
jgi:preprotein translocase subunit SecA